MYADAFSDSEEPPAKKIALSSNRKRDPQLNEAPVPLLSLQPVFNPDLINTNRKSHGSRDF